jgi:hypothetical protein
MNRCLAVVLVLVLSVPAGSAPKLKDAPVPVYYPTRVGDRWVTETKYADSTAEVTEIITAVEKKDDGLVVSIAREADGRASPNVSHVKVSDKGIFRMSQLGTAYDAPYCVLQLPLKPGATWAAEVKRNGAVSSEFKYTAVQEEDIEVPAGKFRAFRIDLEIVRPGRPVDPVRASLWYAPRVGVVRHDYGDKETGYVKVLKSFTPGK